MGGWQYSNSFVIQFQAETEVEPNTLMGRIEHVASNRTTHFNTLEELLTFVNQVLRKRPEEQEQSKPTARNS